jgi:hypothetical protein
MTTEGTIPAPMCVYCKRLAPGGRLHCEAYPDGIPQEIVMSEVDHRKPYKGDGGKQFVAYAKSDEQVVEARWRDRYPGRKKALETMAQAWLRLAALPSDGPAGETKRTRMAALERMVPMVRDVTELPRWVMALAKLPVASEPAFGDPERKKGVVE